MTRHLPPPCEGHQQGTAEQVRSDNGTPKRDSFWDLQPVKAVQQWLHVVEIPGSVDHTRHTVQDRLKFA